MISIVGSKDKANSEKRVASLLEALREKRFLTLFIEPTSRCNLKCGFCDFHSSKSKSFPKKKGMMGLERFNLILDEIEAAGTSFEVIYFYLHGEPLLNPNIVEMVRRAKDAQISKKIFLATNGILLKPEMFNNLSKAGLDKVIVSLDTIDKDRYAAFKGKDALDTVLENLDHAIRQAESKGLIEVVIKCTLPHGNYAISEEEKDSIIEYFKPVAEDSSRVHVEIVHEFSWGESKTQTGENHSPCELPFFQLAIHYDGKASCCCLDIGHDLLIGELGNGSSFNDLLNSDRLQFFRKTLLSGNLDAMPLCKRCDNRTVTNLLGHKQALLEAISEEPL